MASETIHQKWTGGVGVWQGVGMATEKQDYAGKNPGTRSFGAP